jgi:hypothetical protein
MTFLRARSVHGLERIEQRHPAPIEVLDVARDDDPTMHTRWRGEARILDVLFARGQRLAPYRRDGSVHGQDPIPKSVVDRFDHDLERRRGFRLRLF